MMDSLCTRIEKVCRSFQHCYLLYQDPAATRGLLDLAFRCVA